MSEQLEEKIYTYQPTDEEGRPIGGKQVIKYTTHEELAEKLREQNILLIRKLRQETKKVRLGIVETEEISEEVPRFQGPTRFTPRDLTEEERYEISRQMLDPTTVAQATQTLMEATIGAPLSEIGERLNSAEQKAINLTARLEANAFVQETPGYYKCDENFQNICAYMSRYDLAPIKSNFEYAYNKLLQQGAIILGPAEVVETVVEPVVEQVPVEETPKEHVVEQIPQVSLENVGSGLSRKNGSDVPNTPATGDEIVYQTTINGRAMTFKGIAALNAMPSEEYKRRLLSEKGFAAKADKLEQELKASKRR
jgi:hypothetical protein